MDTRKIIEEIEKADKNSNRGKFFSAMEKAAKDMPEIGYTPDEHKYDISNDGKNNVAVQSNWIAPVITAQSAEAVIQLLNKALELTHENEESSYQSENRLKK